MINYLLDINKVAKITLLTIIIILLMIGNIARAEDEALDEMFSQPRVDNDISSIINKGNAFNMAKDNINLHSYNFYIFVTLSMSEHNLKQLLILSKKYQGQLVLRGLKNNSFVQTAKLVQDLQEEEGSIIIDPNLFKEFGIKAVPSYVLSVNNHCPPNTSCARAYDKLTGNVSPRYALELFARVGDLSSTAHLLLLGEQ